MTSSDIFDKMILDIFNALGEPVTYTPLAGTSIPIQALISSSFNTQPSGMGSETWAQHITVEFNLSDLSDAPAIGDVIIDGANTYTLAAPMENNGQIAKWVVT